MTVVKSDAVGRAMMTCLWVILGGAALLVTKPVAAEEPPAGVLAADEPPKKQQARTPSGGPKPATAADPIAPTLSLPVAGSPIPFPLPRTRGGEPLFWDPEWRQTDEWDYTLTAAAGASTLFTAIVKPMGKSWRGGILFDEDARKLRLDSYNQQRSAQDASDVLLALSVTGPILIDAMVTAWWYRGNKQVAKEMAVIDLETLAVTAAVQGLVTTISNRERPYGRTCGVDLPADSLDCTTFGRHRSYFSGHTSLSFASASLVCTHHMNLNLFANGAADVTACISAFAASTATGMLRIMGDSHYASDVISGAIVGTGVGLGLPWLLHYRRRASSLTQDRAHNGFQMQLVPMPTGASAVGTF